MIKQQERDLVHQVYFRFRERQRGEWRGSKKETQKQTKRVGRCGLREMKDRSWWKGGWKG